MPTLTLCGELAIDRQSAAAGTKLAMADCLYMCMHMLTTHEKPSRLSRFNFICLPLKQATQLQEENAWGGRGVRSDRSRRVSGSRGMMSSRGRSRGGSGSRGGLRGGGGCSAVRTRGRRVRGRGPTGMTRVSQSVSETPIPPLSQPHMRGRGTQGHCNEREEARGTPWVEASARRVGRG